MAVQDNERERELVRLFNLTWEAAHERSGVDATIDVKMDDRTTYRFEVEVKSTTTNTVSTARDVGMVHIEKWRNKFFVIGFYDKKQGRPELQTSLCLTPLDMEPWISSIESKIAIDFKIAEIASARLTLDDLFAICGEQESYTVADAKRLHKSQWSAQQYLDARDILVDGKPTHISRLVMLQILRERSQYIAERGATLNNPHITATHLSKFDDTDRVIKENQASRFRAIVSAFVDDHPAEAAKAGVILER